MTVAGLFVIDADFTQRRKDAKTQRKKGPNTPCHAGI
jgi:hypothetical protein